MKIHLHVQVQLSHIPLFLANPEICLSMMADPDYEDWAGWVSWVTTRDVTSCHLIYDRSEFHGTGPV